MEKHSKHIPWWQLYGLVALTIGALMLARSVAPSPTWDKFLDVSTLIIGYILMDAWLRSNLS